MLSADCFDLLTRFDLWALLKSLQDEEVDMALTKIQARLEHVGTFLA